jgi:hypothetical protein
MPIKRLRKPTETCIASGAVPFWGTICHTPPCFSPCESTQRVFTTPVALGTAEADPPGQRPAYGYRSTYLEALGCKPRTTRLSLTLTRSTVDVDLRLSVTSTSVRVRGFPDFQFPKELQRPGPFAATFQIPVFAPSTVESDALPFGSRARLA